MSLLPKAKPARSQKDVLAFLKKKGVDFDGRLVLLAVRSYYLRTMPKKRGVFNDAAFWVSPNVFASFNFNCDPSIYREGYGTGSKKGVASLKAGVWKYKTGLHKSSYQAFRQAEAVTVIRDGNPPYEHTYFDLGINIHRGGSSGTSSLGCLTVPVGQWDLFKQIGYKELDRLGQKTFQLVLVDEKETGWNNPLF